MKKIISLILALSACMLALCSCGGAGISEMTGAYKIENNVFYYSVVDKAYNPEDGYTIKESDGKTALFRTYLGISGEKIEEEIGALKAFSLGKSNFDNLIYGDGWQNGDSAEGIRKANKSAWKAEKKDGEVFYILLQDNGEVLVSSVKTKEGFKHCAYIRKISK
jgi:hypothetical protein